jgi:hypothetical protein
MRWLVCLLFACSSPKTPPTSSEPITAPVSTTIDSMEVDAMQADAMQVDAAPAVRTRTVECAGYRDKAADACVERGCTYGPHTPCSGVILPYQDPKPCGCICGKERPCERP